MTTLENLEEQIKVQGELVRKLKAAKEDKERVKIQEEITKLLELKAQISDPKNARQKFTIKTPKGSRDFSPEQMALRSYVLGRVEYIFEKNGAKTIDTPLFEFKEVLTEKYGEDSKLIYDLEEYDGEVLSLRYDLTVPLARYLGKNKIKNFKRYQIAPVYRRDNPSIARGRFREFYQCDLDIAGIYEPMKPDAECIKIVYEILTDLDLKPFVIKINHRSLLDGMLEVCGVPANKFRSICSAVDKLDKSPWLEVKKEMIEEKGLTEDVVDKIGEYVRLNGGVQLVDELLQNQELIKSKSAVSGLEAIKVLLKYCESQGTLDSVSFDLSLARGLDYYTGVIYEAVLSTKDSGDNDELTVGSVAGGGRYDNLVGMFNSENETVPCVGVSIGIERIFTVLEAKFAASNQKKRTTEVGVYIATAQKNLFSEKIKLCKELSTEDFKIGFSYKKNPKLLAQLQHCEEQEIPYAIILGESELQRGIVKLRKVSTREEVEVSRDCLSEELRKRLQITDMMVEENTKLEEMRALLKDCRIAPSEFSGNTPKGTIDFSQEQMALRKYVLRTISSHLKKHGAETISTPVFELKEVLKDKYGPNYEIIYDLKDQGGEKLSLRYDLTVPFARYLAMNKKMSMICCQIAKVYRRDKPSIEKGVFREFYQADFDIAGSYDSMIPESHCIWIMYDILNSFKIPDFVIKINHRALLDAVLLMCGVPADQLKNICSTLEKLDKLPWPKIKEEIVEKGIPEDVAHEMGKYVTQYGGRNLVSHLLQNEELVKNKAASEALKDIELLLEYCDLFGTSHVMCFDLGFTRGLDYYTGIVFEAVFIGEDYNVKDENSVGSLAGGGRYDNLVGTFDSKSKSVPCVGFSIGVDRIFSVLENELAASKKNIFISTVEANLDGEAKTLYNELVDQGFKVDHFQHSEKTDISSGIILCVSEIQKGVVKLKEVSTGVEIELSRDRVIEELRNRVPNSS
ncbi:histidine--tRNA ligase isoform X2 [Coccinella septempunctata]|uniref:histidine--tRNA ligase isoform X2 n=1 Tax=Coccinella septempunctata TaxID=41139 RepID=UPI001D05E7E8|nr:histidine--tRNA ligase isoform X2 [Coccinella septempunctata]